jgi:hypothetical protein
MSHTEIKELGSAQPAHVGGLCRELSFEQGPAVGLDLDEVAGVVHLRYRSRTGAANQGHRVFDSAKQTVRLVAAIA